jgi:hypothetical protein
MRSHRRTSVIRSFTHRRGYALMLVLLFNVLFLMLLGVAWRRMGSVLRIASVRTTQVQRDEGSLRVLADAMRLLETGLPPTTPYERGVIVTLPTSGQERFFIVRFERDDTPPPEERKYWSVTVTRTDERPQELLPTYFPTASP